MSITIELSPEVEARLRVDAARRGLSPGEFLCMMMERRYPALPKEPYAFPPPGFAAHLYPKDTDAAQIVREMRDEWDKPK